MIEIRHIEGDASCTGCFSCHSACPAGAIGSKRGLGGFLYPEVDPSACTRCGRCLSACPLTAEKGLELTPSAYACQAHDEALLAGSSSGGVFSLLALSTLQAGGVVFGAALGTGLEVMHVGIERPDEIPALRGSKYVQSDTRGLYGRVSQVLEAGRPALFSGTPCQVAALRAFLGGGTERLTCVDFFCHGVPSPQAWRRYLQFQEGRSGSRADAASFRDKSSGWRRFSMFLHFENGRVYRRTHDRDPYLRAYLADICLRDSCHECRFKGLSRWSDITLADFWGVENIAPGLDDDKGTSLVLVSTAVGREALSAVQHLLDWEEVPLGEATSPNKAAVDSVDPHPGRSDFLRSVENVRFDRLVRRSLPLSPMTAARARASHLRRKLGFR